MGLNMNYPSVPQKYWMLVLVTTPQSVKKLFFHKSCSMKLNRYGKIS